MKTHYLHVVEETIRRSRKWSICRGAFLGYNSSLPLTEIINRRQKITCKNCKRILEIAIKRLNKKWKAEKSFSFKKGYDHMMLSMKVRDIQDFLYHNFFEWETTHNGKLTRNFKIKVEIEAR